MKPNIKDKLLDIGCGSASSLMAMAAQMPECQFTGIDFSGPDIASAQEMAREAGLTNVELQQADLMNWDPRGAKFDFIIAYGFFSWVPDEVKDRLFKLIAGCLAPQGIACVSYMTYPGCKQPEALRDLLKLHTDSLQDPLEKVAAAHRTLDFLDRAWQGLPKFAHSRYLREEVRRIRQKEPHFLVLDDLGVERDPCYLLQFTNWAAEHGLTYLGESEFHTMLLENLPLESGKELAAMGLDRLQTEQLIDYITNRAFRCSLLVGAQATLPALLDAQALRGLCIRSSLNRLGCLMPALQNA
jgi:ubiquinone/menaquinone biosynthesis C-methylase UbiE